MKTKRYGYHADCERSIYISDGYNRDTYAIYAWKDLPAHTSSPVNPVRCFIEGGFPSIEEAEKVASEREGES